MKRNLIVILCIMMLFSSGSDRIVILNNAYLGMTVDEYEKAFGETYTLRSSASKVVCTPRPRFTRQRLESLSLAITDIPDNDTAYTVFELANDFRRKYGSPVESRETVWAGGSSRYLRWKKDRLEVIYSYTYNQNPGTSGKLYFGEAMLTYKTDSGRF